MASRNYSFVNANPDRFDSASLDGLEQIIPARVGTTYWAILRVMYARPHRPLSVDELTHEVENLLSRFDGTKWQRFVSKPDAKPWRERLIMSAQILTRHNGNNPYGQRLAERGYQLAIVCSGDNRSFVLRADATGNQD